MNEAIDSEQPKSPGETSTAEPLLRNRLLACPFCGGAGMIRAKRRGFFGGQILRPCCVLCSAEIRNNYDTEELATEAWNTRAR